MCKSRRLLALLTLLVLGAVAAPLAQAANGRIAFASDRDGDYDIYTVRPDGSDLLQLTSNSFDDRDPAWSPDGNRIAYVAGGQLWMMNADGTGKQRLTGSQEVMQPVWSPNGRQIIFSTRRTLYRVAVPGGSVVELTPDAKSDVYYHASSIVSPRWVGGTLTALMNYGWCPSFIAPEVFWCDAIIGMDENGSEPRLIANLGDLSGGPHSFDWAGDGSRLVYAVGDPERAARDLIPSTDLILLNLASGERSNLTRNPREVVDARPRWSPDGTMIVFQSAVPRSDYQRDHGVPSEINLINADGSGRRSVASSPAYEVEPDWQRVTAATRPQPAAVARVGAGLATWRIGMRRAVRPGLLRSERFPRNDGPGCIGGPYLASWVDHYPGFRASYVRGRGTATLAEIATTRVGDRSADGFVIGRSRFAEVRRQHPRALLWNEQGRFALGTRTLMHYQRTGYEAGRSLSYSFDRQGMLVALASGVSGC